MTWLAIAAINEFEIDVEDIFPDSISYAVRCPEHGMIRTINVARPLKLKEIFRAIAEHVDERHRN